ncbi:MAG: hypothetical protein U0R64_01450 [Candidatus Nanopelagicales bacterium]
MTSPVLRDGGVLLHVGPHKTGTTAIQGALAAARPLLKRERILYPGRRLEHNRQAAAAIQRSLGWDRRRLDMAYWDTLVAQAARYPGRVVISSEVFCEADAESAARIVHDLGPDRVQVAVTLRPLEKLLPSNWQQYIKSGYRIRYEHWLENVFETREKSSAATPSFWVRNDHPAVIRRWSEVIGPENLVVVVVDSAEPRSLFDSFEDILQLPRNSLNADESGPSNRSLSAYEVELLRQFNRRVRNRITHTDYYRFVKRGAVRTLVEGRTPGPHEPRVTTPGWAIERARMISKEHVAEIGAMGVPVIGNLEALVPTSPIPDDEVIDVRQVPVGLAAQFMASLLEAGIDITQRAEDGTLVTAATSTAESSSASVMQRVRGRLAGLRNRVK